MFIFLCFIPEFTPPPLLLDELPSNQVELLPSDNPLNRPKMLNFLESSIKKKTNQFLSDNVRVLSVSRASRGYK